MEGTHVWIRTAAEITADDGVLSPAELARAGRLRSDADRERFRAARTLLRQVLAGLLDIAPAAVRFELEEHGKPYLAHRPFEVNLSHSGDLVAIAASPEPVGIDVEQIKARTSIDAIAGRYFQGSELRFLESLPEAERREAFFSLWTVKEAAMKADGGGVWLSLATITIDDPSHAGVAAVRCAVNRVPWLVRPLAVPHGYRGALATKSETAIVLH